MSALSIFDPQKVPSTDSVQLPTYGNQSISVLLEQFGTDKPGVTIDGEETVKSALISF